MKLFKNNFCFQIFFSLTITIAIFIFAEICVRLIPFTKHWEGDITNFWNLEQYTNILGNYDNKKIIDIKHTGVPPIFNEKVSVKKPKDTIRIICLGTSSTEGFIIKNPDDVYPKALEKMLNNRETGLHFEVINAAVGGYTSFQLLIYLKQVLLKLSPDVVTLYLSFNDSNYRGPISDKDYWEWVNKKVRNLPYNIKKDFIIYHTSNPVFIRFHRLLNKSKLYILLKLVILNTKQKLMGDNYVKRVPIGNFRKALEQFVEMGRENNFYIIFIPEAVSEIYPDINISEVRKYHRIMEDIARKNENVILVEVHNLLNQNPSEFLFDKMHPTEKGHLIIAQKIYDALKTINVIK